MTTYPGDLPRYPSKQHYPSNLPHSFIVPLSLAEVATAVLLEPDLDYPNGSSFAVGSNARSGERVLQLSDASLRRVEAHLGRKLG